MIKFIKLIFSIIIFLNTNSANAIQQFNQIDLKDLSILPSVELHLENLPSKKIVKLTSPDHYSAKHNSQKHKDLSRIHKPEHHEVKLPSYNNKNKISENASIIDQSKHNKENKNSENISKHIDEKPANNVNIVHKDLETPLANDSKVSASHSVVNDLPNKKPNENITLKDENPKALNYKADHKKPVIQPDVNNLLPITTSIENKIKSPDDKSDTKEDNAQVQKQQNTQSRDSVNNDNNKMNPIDLPSVPQVDEKIKDNLLPTSPPIDSKSLDNLPPITSFNDKDRNSLPSIPTVNDKNSLPQLDQKIDNSKASATPDLVLNSLMTSVIFQKQGNDIKGIDKSILDITIKTLLTNNKNIKIIAYSSSEVPDNLQIINLQRLIAIKKYSQNNNIADHRINTSIDSKNLSKIDSNRTDIVYTD